MSNLLLLVLQLASFLFIARAILSWFPGTPGSTLGQISDVLARLTEPVLGPIRRVLPPMGGIDLSIIIVILGINFVLVPIARQF